MPPTSSNQMINLKKTDLPNSPGVYKFLNKNLEIIYVGKSKNLKKRVKSYFQKQQNNKISKMVKEIVLDSMLKVSRMGNGIFGIRAVKKTKLVFIKMARKMAHGKGGILMVINFLNGIITMEKKKVCGFGGMITII